MYEPLLNLSRSIRNKADALQFAVIATMQQKCGEPSKIDYDEAKKLFDFFCENVDFPEESTRQLLGDFLPIIEAVLGGNPYDLTAELNKLKVGETN